MIELIQVPLWYLILPQLQGTFKLCLNLNSVHKLVAVPVAVIF